MKWSTTNKMKLNPIVGKTRTIRLFAWLPTRVINISSNQNYIIWLEDFYLLQIEYKTKKVLPDKDIIYYLSWITHRKFIKFNENRETKSKF